MPFVRLLNNNGKSQWTQRRRKREINIYTQHAIRMNGSEVSGANDTLHQQQKQMEVHSHQGSKQQCTAPEEEDKGEEAL